MLYCACCRESPRSVTERHRCLQDGLGFAYQGHKIVMELVKEDTDEIIGEAARHSK